MYNIKELAAFSETEAKLEWSTEELANSSSRALILTLCHFSFLKLQIFPLFWTVIFAEAPSYSLPVEILSCRSDYSPGSQISQKVCIIITH